MMVNPNIFRSRNNWNVIAFNCEKYKPNLNNTNHFYKLTCIINKVVEATNVSLETFVSKTRYRPAVEARQLYFKRAKETTDASLADIGSMVQSGDHSTVIHGIKQVENVPSLIRKYNEIFNGYAPRKPIEKIIKHEKSVESKTYLPVYGVPTYN